MDDLISRQVAIDALNEVSEHYTEKGREWHPHVSFMIDAIKELPPAQPTSDVVEVVRCKECKHAHLLTFENGIHCLSCNYQNAHGMLVENHGFCYWGERREDG